MWHGASVPETKWGSAEYTKDCLEWSPNHVSLHIWLLNERSGLLLSQVHFHIPGFLGRVLLIGETPHFAKFNNSVTWLVSAALVTTSMTTGLQFVKSDFVKSLKTPNRNGRKEEYSFRANSYGDIWMVYVFKVCYFKTSAYLRACFVCACKRLCRSGVWCLFATCNLQDDSCLTV